LGWVTPKLNANELDAIPRLAGLTDFQAALELRVRSYLDVNCGACHRPGGPSRGNFDARFVTPLTRQRLLDGELAAGNLGISDERIIVPGRPEKSVLLRRLEGRDSFRMPPVSVNDDTPPIVLPLKQWIEGMHKESAFQTR